MNIKTELQSKQPAFLRWAYRLAKRKGNKLTDFELWFAYSAYLKGLGDKNEKILKGEQK